MGGFESSRDEGSLSSCSDDGRKSVNSKKSGTSLMIEGTTTEETSTDLSLDENNLNRTSNTLNTSEDDVKDESVPEDPIIPVLKADTHMKLLENVEENSSENKIKKIVDTSETVKQEYKTKKETQREEKLLRQQEERRIA